MDAGCPRASRACAQGSTPLRSGSSADPFPCGFGPTVEPQAKYRPHVDEASRRTRPQKAQPDEGPPAPRGLESLRGRKGGRPLGTSLFFDLVRPHDAGMLQGASARAPAKSRELCNAAVRAARGVIKLPARAGDCHSGCQSCGEHGARHVFPTEGPDSIARPTSRGWAPP